MSPLKVMNDVNEMKFDEKEPTLSENLHDIF